MPPSPRWTEPSVAIVPIEYSRSGVTSSPSSRCPTTNTRCSGSRSAASMAFSVCGRPAEIGRLIPGNNTPLRIGMMGRVFDMAL
jgi:hypothetical protein